VICSVRNWWRQHSTVGRKMLADTLTPQHSSQYRKWDGMCEKCGKSESYLGGEIKSPLFKRVWEQPPPWSVAPHQEAVRGHEYGVWLHGACLGVVTRTWVRVFVKVTCVDPTDSLFVCQRCIDFLANLEQLCVSLAIY